MTGSSRRAAQTVVRELLERVAPEVGAEEATLALRDGWVVRGEQNLLRLGEAAALAGPAGLSAVGRNPGPGKLGDSGVAGVQMADVTVDVETGVVRMNRMVAVQDCGLVVNRKLAESQVHGGLIMGIGYALYEELVSDPLSGRILNADMEFYRLASLLDVGRLDVHLMGGPGHDERGVIGLGEPPVISPGAAISNAVANAIGVRVPFLPMTPERVLAALDERRLSWARGWRMRPFSYAAPSTVAEALDLMLEPGATPLAGGTDLLSLLKSDVVQHDLLVDLKRIPALRGITVQGDGLHFGATTTLEELRMSDDVARFAPALLDAVQKITAPQIRSMGTLAGDLCQRPRCWYFRSGFGLLGERNYSSMAEGGDSRYHAIFGSGPARFVSASRLAPALAALGAVVEYLGPEGERQVPVHQFFRSPQSSEEREIDLGPGELVTGVRIQPAGWFSAGYEVQPRRSLDWPLAAASAAVDLRGGEVVAAARIVLGHVAPVPWLAASAAAELVGSRLTDASIEAASVASVVDSSPLEDNRYKVQLTRVAVRRALDSVRERIGR